MICTAAYSSPVGELLLAAEGEELLGLWLPGQRYYAAEVPEDARLTEDLPVLTKTKAWLADYFSGGKPDIAALALNPRGSAFRQQVWKLLCEISYGEVTTYGALAREVEMRTGRPASPRAVGGAVGHNPISIIIPCHRVIGSGGSLTGYAGGLEAKTFLLRHEGHLR
ncbi:MAG: methylated-DNA--[protein]-cysteine S-methyltransferase [Oscillospiraceae bacterium]|nr:methylated-DNA--[protein]-cysteine S-methyltransferase [Oscillospiraceae bacterium]